MLELPRLMEEVEARVAEALPAIFASARRRLILTRFTDANSTEETQRLGQVLRFLLRLREGKSFSRGMVVAVVAIKRWEEEGKEEEGDDEAGR